ncbi:MAG: hypothetical protein J2P15_08990 [Micromonosporaceae bacterium]|nr:hypothetical protein [Micromonosporaceae bacterium]
MSQWTAPAQEIRGESQQWDAQVPSMTTVESLIEQLQLVKPGYDNVGFFQDMVDVHSILAQKARALADQAGNVFFKIGNSLVQIAGVYEATDAQLSANLHKAGSTAPVPTPRPRPRP